ncbi:MAG: dienelactone hydrolase, partial [Candidatus Hinthialibacter sp.]
MLPGKFERFEYPTPQSAEQWENEKKELRLKLWRLLGDIPEPFTPQPTITKREQRNGYLLEKFQFENGVGDAVYGYFALPEGCVEPVPAILYHHYHGGEYGNAKEEILKNYPIDKPPVESFTEAGYAVMAIDAYAF